jgi:Tol biopolymer transport system component
MTCVSKRIRRSGCRRSAIAGVFAVLAAAVAFLYFHQAPPSAEALRLSVNLPPDARPGFLEISPDGRRIVVSMNVHRKPGLYVRSLDSGEFRLLEGTRGARTPFCSPDSRFIGFFADGKLKVIPAAGGPATAMCSETGLGGGGTWNQAGVILFGTDRDLRRVKASGGECSTVKLGEENYRAGYPVFLPDGNHFLCFCGSTADLSTVGVYVASLDGAKPRKVLNDVSSVVYAPPASPKALAHLIFLRGTTLMAQPFDSGKLEAVGDPFAVASQVSTTLDASQVAASAAPNGTLIYAGNTARQIQLTWIDRSGKELGKVGEPGDLAGLSLSPDGGTAAFSEVTPADPLGVLRLFDLARDSSSRFIPSGKLGYAAVWSPDGSRILYRSLDAGKPNLMLKEANGNGQEMALLPPSTNARYGSDWSRDGRYLIYTEVDPKTRGISGTCPIRVSRRVRE